MILLSEKKDQKTTEPQHIKTEYKVLSGPKGVGEKINLDDALDVFAVHGVGGAIGTISLAIFGNITFGGLGIDNIGEQLLIQIKGVGAVIIWSAVGTYIIVKICQSITGLRVSDEDINHGLDKAEHGETSYNFH